MVERCESPQPGWAWALFPFSAGDGVGKQPSWGFMAAIYKSLAVAIFEPTKINL